VICRRATDAPCSSTARLGARSEETTAATISLNDNADREKRPLTMMVATVAWLFLAAVICRQARKILKSFARRVPLKKLPPPNKKMTMTKKGAPSSSSWPSFVRLLVAWASYALVFIAQDGRSLSLTSFLAARNHHGHTNGQAFFCTSWRSSVAVMPIIMRRPRTATVADVVAAGTDWRLASSFYSDFEEQDDDEDEDEDDDDDEDEDDDEFTDLDVAAFRNKMSSLFGDDGDGGGSASSASGGSAVSSVDELIDFARSQIASAGDEDGSQKKTDWAESVSPDMIKEGVILLANPAMFCSDEGGIGSGSSSTPNPSLLSKFGLTLPPPADLGPDRRADLLPVLIVVEKSPAATRAVLLNRRTGYLLGDLEQPGEDASTPPAPLLEKFCIQPLWFGGVDNVSTGLDMLHQCPDVRGSKKLSEDGLYWGGDPGQAQDTLNQSNGEDGRVLTGFDFKFFVQSTVWSPGELERQVQEGTWFCATVSREVIFKSRDRMGTQRAKVSSQRWLAKR